MLKKTIESSSNIVNSFLVTIPFENCLKSAKVMNVLSVFYRDLFVHSSSGFTEYALSRFFDPSKVKGRPKEKLHIF